MNDLLLRRRIAVINSTPSLPYDAEIEYLESTGTQYIDTGILFDSTYKYEMEVGHFANGTTGLIVWGARSQNTYKPKTTQLSYTATRKIMCFAGDSITGTSSSAYGTVITLSSMLDISIGCYPTKYFKVNGVSVTVGNFMQERVFKSEYNIYIFGINNYGTANLQKCRYSKYTVYDEDDNLVQDLIPVRVGTTGYMYDKVSGTLFGNSGTDDFILGNDIA